MGVFHLRADRGTEWGISDTKGTIIQNVTKRRKICPVTRKKRFNGKLYDKRGKTPLRGK